MSTSSSTVAGPSDADKAAVAGVPGRIVAAWAAHDADAFAKVFTDDGVMILPGQYQKGRAGISAFMSAAFSGPYKGTQVTGQPIDLRFLTADSAVLVTQGGVLAAGEKEVAADRGIRATWVVVKQDGEWRLANYQNSPKNN